jgi:hypothetical protein
MLKKRKTARYVPARYVPARYVPARYVPRTLSSRDRHTIRKELVKSRRLYKRGLYHTRTKVPSYPHRQSKHLLTAKRLYGLRNIYPSPALAAATGCSVAALQAIVRKGEGAYYSSGSRPNQTAQSWGLARLASAVTGGKASGVDYHILENGCRPTSKALRLAQTPRAGHRRVKKIRL